MCFAPQRRALFRHRNFQKWSEHGVSSKRASHHNGVHLFDITTSKSRPNLVCFVHFDFEMCFAPQRRAIFHLSSGQLEPQITEKNIVFRDFPTFSRTWIFFFWDFLFFDLLSSSLLFSSVHIVGNFTSKLPSMTCYCTAVIQYVSSDSICYKMFMSRINVVTLLKNHGPRSRLDVKLAFLAPQSRRNQLESVGCTKHFSPRKTIWNWEIFFCIARYYTYDMINIWNINSRN